MASGMAWCSLHGIAYNRALDPHCPQCTIGRVSTADQFEYTPPDPAPVQQPKLGAKIVTTAP